MIAKKKNAKAKKAAEAKSVEQEIVVDVDRTSEAEPEGQLSEEEKLQIKCTEAEDKYLRLAAEFDNYKKRATRQYQEGIRFANDGLLVRILEVIDNFERAQNHANGNEEPLDAETLKQGTQLIFNQLKDILTRYEITPIEAIGNQFDPHLHEALMQIDSDEYESGIVALEIAKGYRAGERVLRHAKVAVSKGRPTKSEEEAASQDREGQ